MTSSFRDRNGDQLVVVPIATLRYLEFCFQQNYPGPDRAWQRLRNEVLLAEEEVPETDEEIMRTWARNGGAVANTLEGKRATITTDNLCIYLRMLYRKMAFWADCNQRMGTELLELKKEQSNARAPERL